MGLLSTYPASTTEGRLISTPDAEAGSGGRLGALEMRRRFPQPAVQAASSRRANRVSRARLTADAGAVRYRRRREGSLAVDRRLCVQKGRLKGKSTGGDAEQTYKHCARDAGDLADLRLFGSVSY